MYPTQALCTNAWKTRSSSRGRLYAFRTQLKYCLIKTLPQTSHFPSHCPPMVQVESKSSILPPWGTTYSLWSTCPSYLSVGHTAPLPGNPANYTKCIAADSLFQCKWHKNQEVGRKLQHSSLFQQKHSLPHRVAVFQQGCGILTWWQHLLYTG